MSRPRKAAVSIQKGVYSMACADGDSATITMYGDIYGERPTDWWGEPAEGQFILLSEFMEDLERLAGCREITIRMNSYGGDAGVANTIHNRLRELSREGAALTCVVDGVAMSGGSLIMCACDNVKVNPASLIMIHKCWTYLWGSYNADELRKQAEQQSAWDKMQVEIYKRKTGLSDTVLSHMMSDTTYMTGREAVEKGFADELMEDAEPLDIAASADGRALYVRDRKFHLAPGMFAPDNIPTFRSEATAPPEENTNTPTGEKGGNASMAENLEGLERPEVQANAEEAAKAERRRIQEIDALAPLYDAETIREAKYGENACTAQEMTYRAAQKAAKQGRRFISDIEEDFEASKAGEVPAVSASEEQEAHTPEQRMAAARAEVKSLFRKEDK